MSDFFLIFRIIDEFSILVGIFMFYCSVFDQNMNDHLCLIRINLQAFLALISITMATPCYDILLRSSALSIFTVLP